MAITIGPVTLPRSAAELLDPTDGYDAGALVWLASAASSSGPWTTVASEAIEAGVEAIYFRDPSGTSSTWYRTWLSKAAGAEPSEYSDPFQPAAAATGYTTLERVKRHAGIADAVDDAQLIDYIAAVDAELTRRLGVFLGPSTDTVRILDGSDAVRGGHRLWIPGGIRTLTQVRTSASWGADWETRTLTDFALGPRRYGHPGPYAYVEVSPSATGLPCGAADVELTGTFGWAEVPEDIAKLADMVVLRMWMDRSAGPLTQPTPSKFIYADDARMLGQYRDAWGEGPGLR